MSAIDSSRSSLQIKEVLKTSLALLAKNIPLLISLAVLVDLFVWISLEGLFDNIKHHPFFESAEGSPMTNNIESPASSSSDQLNERSNGLAYETAKKQLNELLHDPVKILFYPVAYVFFLTLVTSKLIYSTLQDGRTKIRVKDLVACYKSISASDVLRTSGVTACYYVSFLSCLFFSSILIGVANGFARVLLKKIYPIGESVPAIVVIAILLISVAITMWPLLYLFVSRWSLIIPVTLIENTNVRKSFKRSWNLTAACWKKLLGLIVLMEGLFLIGTLVVWSSIVYLYLFGVENFDLAEFWDQYFEGFLLGYGLFGYVEHLLFTGMIGIAASLVISVCYYYLRKTEGGDGNALLLLSP